MNLLDKASIILTPTAYNNGEALCVKPSDGSGDFDFSRNSAATRVNAQGLVEDVQILSGNLVQNGDFSELGAEQVSNGSFSQQGSELVTNGDFTNNINGWVNYNSISTWDNGTIKTTATTNAAWIRQNGVLTPNKNYKVTFKAKASNISQNLKIYNGSGFIDTNLSFDQTDTYKEFTYYLYTVDTHCIIGQQNVSIGDTINFDNVSVVEVGQDWTLETGWSIGEDKAISDGSGSVPNTDLVQSSVFTSGNTYKISLQIEDYVSGRLELQNNTTDFPQANGTHTMYFVAGSGTAIVLRSRGFIGSITNISVKEVGQNWTITGTGWSIGDGKLTGLAAEENVTQAISTTVGKKYKLKFTILDWVSGDVYVRPNNMAGTEFYVNGNGDYIEEFTAINTSPIIVIRARPSQPFSGSITNISVIEITDDTNLPRISYENFTYDGSGNIVPDSGCGSWLFEPQSTNLIPYSEDFSDSSWFKESSATLGLNTYLSPSGENNASKLYLPNTLSRITYPLATTGVYTYSIYLKSDTDGTISLRAATGNPAVTKQLNLTDRWQRFDISVTDGNYWQVIKTASDTLTSVYIWGAQLEQQSYATSYIPTSGQASGVTRNQDVCTNGGSLASINSTEGVLYAEIAALADDGSTRRISIIGASSSDRINISFSAGSNTLQCFAFVGGALQFNFTPTLSNIKQFNKIALKYKENDFALWVNGVEIATKTSGISWSANTLKNLVFANSSLYAEPFFGKTKCLAVWKEALSDEELTELTTI